MIQDFMNISTVPNGLFLDGFTLMLMGHIAFGRNQLVPVGKIHYFFHWLYGRYEPQILRFTDWVLCKKFITDTAIGRAFCTGCANLGHYLPHGIVVTTQSATNLIRYIDSLKSQDNSPRLAVGPSVCQKALNRWKDPSCKDIVVLYGVDIYLSLNMGYKIIDADEAVAILERCRDYGLVHSLDFCMQSGQWHFVICNCDRDICLLVRTFLVTGKMIYAGPLIVKQDKEHCLGPEACGQCVNICMFGANSIRDQAIHVDGRKCYGCGQCVRVCRGKVRELVRRARYEHDKVIPAQVLLPEMAIGNEKQAGR
jgi:NAD-dependent dihydropyrimidine dehydrogenase PreA subunit